MTHNLCGQLFYVDSHDVIPHGNGGFHSTKTYPLPFIYPTTQEEGMLVRDEVIGAFSGLFDASMFPIFESMRDLMERARQRGKTEILVLCIRLSHLMYTDLASLGPAIGYTYPLQLE